MNHLVGKFFHIMSINGEEKIQYQGSISQALDNDYYLVQFYSFLDGTKTRLEIFHISHMVYWRLYETNEDWVSAYNHSYKGDTE